MGLQDRDYVRTRARSSDNSRGVHDGHSQESPSVGAHSFLATPYVLFVITLILIVGSVVYISTKSSDETLVQSDTFAVDGSWTRGGTDTAALKITSGDDDQFNFDIFAVYETRSSANIGEISGTARRVAGSPYSYLALVKSDSAQCILTFDLVPETRELVRLMRVTQTEHCRYWGGMSVTFDGVYEKDR